MIEETIGATLHRFQVLSPGGGASAWRYRDATRTQLRLHTKLIATEAPEPPEPAP